MKSLAVAVMIRLFGLIDTNDIYHAIGTFVNSSGSAGSNGSSGGPWLGDLGSPGSKYFLRQDWTIQISLIHLGKFVSDIRA
jgi:hypothetical protein